MKNFKRAAAIAGAAILLLVFCLPMIFAFGNGEDSQAMFRASIGAAIMVPVLAYIFWMVSRIFGKQKPKEREIENIIFDVGQVLVTYDWKTYLESFGFPKEKFDKIANATFLSQTWIDRDKGGLSEEEYVEKFVSLAPEYEDDIREVMRRTPECITVRDYSETWVKYLKNQGYHLYVLSNYCLYMLEKNRPQMTFLKYMDGEIFSCNVEDLKPNHSIYRTLLETFGLEAEKCVFLDDRPENCKAAKEVGIRAIQFQNFKQGAAELEKLGIK